MFGILKIVVGAIGLSRGIFHLNKLDSLSVVSKNKEQHPLSLILPEDWGLLKEQRQKQVARCHGIYPVASDKKEKIVNFFATLQGCLYNNNGVQRPLAPNPKTRLYNIHCSECGKTFTFFRETVQQISGVCSHCGTVTAIAKPKTANFWCEEHQRLAQMLLVGEVKAVNTCSNELCKAQVVKVGELYGNKAFFDKIHSLIEIKLGEIKKQKQKSNFSNTEKCVVNIW